MTDFPVSVGNVTYLDGNPPEGDLKAIATEMTAGVNVDGKVASFVEQMNRHGRCCSAEDVEVWHCMGLTDLLYCGSLMVRASWIGNYRAPGDEKPLDIVQVLNGEGRGYWCEIAPRVLLHTKLNRDLSAKQLASFLAESDTPSPALVHWLEQHLVPDAPTFTCGGIEDLPNEIRIMASSDTFLLQRLVRFTNEGGTIEAPLFQAFERPNFRL